MKFVKHTVALLLLVLLFVGNVGVNVFKHICKEDGTIVSYVFNEADEHCGMHVEEEELPPCCHEDLSSEEEDDDCCSDEVEYFKLKIEADVPDSDAPFVPVQAVLTSAPQVELNMGMFDYYTSNYVNPPPPDSREILLQKQVWVI